MDLAFYKNKSVLITGHTGFKGSWMCKTLINAGANVTGFALEPPNGPNLFEICNLSKCMDSIIGDVRNLELVNKVFSSVKPDIVIHMAAQPLVRESYINPVNTYDVNVMGTVNILEAIRNTDCVKSVVNVTTDKVYLNKEWEWGYRENEELKGFDPYSNSKSCSELVTYSYVNSFFKERDIAVSTVRAGNVIGGGDFANDRIIPDCIRAASIGKDIIVRNPYSIRPYQHVLETIYAYLLLAKKQYLNAKLADNYNVGPNETECWTTGDLVTLFCNQWNEMMQTEVSWEKGCDLGPHEATFLKLDCSKIKNKLDWKPQWDIENAMKKIVEWYREYFYNGDVSTCMDNQIQEFYEATNDRKNKAIY